MKRSRARSTLSALGMMAVTLSGCASVNELSFADDDASVTSPDASSADDGSVAGDAKIADATSSDTRDETSAADARVDDAGAADAGASDTGVDGGCIASGQVTCCGPVRCVGACAGNCSYCPTTCSPGQLCCILVNGAGKVKRNDCVQAAVDCN